MAAEPATLYLGSHHATSRWWALGIPLFVSVRVLGARKSLPVAVAPWALDSGGFTEISKHGRWETTEDEYVEQVERLAAIGGLAWVAPQDWMCEPDIIHGNPARGWPGTVPGGATSVSDSAAPICECGHFAADHSEASCAHCECRGYITTADRREQSLPPDGVAAFGRGSDTNQSGVTS